MRITIDSREVEVAAGSRLLDAARVAGIQVPSLCADPRLAPYGSCRTCMVSLEGVDGPVPACTTPASDGAVIRTDDPAARATARVALELIVGSLPPCELVEAPES